MKTMNDKLKVKKNSHEFKIFYNEQLMNVYRNNLYQ